MRTLVVLPFSLRAEGGAAERCAIGLLRGLLELGVDCQALVAETRDVVDDAPPADLPVEVMRFEYPSLARTRAQRFMKPHDLFAHTPFLGRVQQLARDVDVVHLVGLQSATFIPRLDGPALAQIDCDSKRDRDIGRPWTANGKTAIELRRAERRVFRHADWLLASSEEVARDFRHRAPAGTHIAVGPLSLDPQHYAGRAPLEEPVAGLIGTAEWPPTANAVERLLRDVWPRVLRDRPGARLRLAGRGMERETFAHLPDLPGVEWCGRVDSATDFLRGLGLLLYPLSRGSGAKIKVLEALALGLPIVTTPDGAEGIIGRGGLTVETDDGRLAGAAVTLLDDVQARRAAGEAAHRTFAEHHAPAPAAAPVLELYRRMVA